ncbi:MAG: uracil-DNA glycosylase [Acidobacteria bacterium]|nr:uracil-DNA glycosylase [Acidobacteriota bacterium]
MDSLPVLRSEIENCRQCPRLVAWREQVAAEKVARFRHQTYWGKPVPGFGDPQARLVVVGLAPAAHGGNRTGRVFTGDKSGDWLYRALHKAGFANQATSTDARDGLILTDCYIGVVVRCAPPDNKPTPLETETCRTFLARELKLLESTQVILALGKFAFDNVVKILKSQGLTVPQPVPHFGHNRGYHLGTKDQPLFLIGSYHPSQRNTSTGFLTEPMFDEVFSTIRSHLGDTVTQ